MVRGGKKTKAASLSDSNARLLPAPVSPYARASCRKINELSSTKRKRILYLAWRYLLTLRMIISISELSATQVSCEMNKGATVSLSIRLQGDVDVHAIQVQIMSSPPARIRACSTLVVSKSARSPSPKLTITSRKRMRLMG